MALWARCPPWLMACPPVWRVRDPLSFSPSGQIPLTDGKSDFYDLLVGIGTVNKIVARWWTQRRSIRCEVSKMGVNCERAINLELSPQKKSRFGFCGWILSAKRCELDVFCQSQSRGKQMKHHFDRSPRKKTPTFFFFKVSPINQN